MPIKLTNKLGLPESIVRAVQNDSYDPGCSDYTATSLIKPARMKELERTNTLEVDVSMRLWSLQGQIMHFILQRAADSLDKFIVEKRFYHGYTVDGKSYSVSAQVDLLDTKAEVLSDYKYTSTGSHKFGLKEDYYWQLNIQAELARKNGYKVSRAEVVSLFRDWSAEKDYTGYPDPVVKQEVPLLPSKQVDEYIVARIREHEAAKRNLPLCNDEERWNRKTYAVMKDELAKRALPGSLTDSKEVALQFIKDKAPNGILQERGSDRRCLGKYCDAWQVCKQAHERNPELLEDLPDEDGFVTVK